MEVSKALLLLIALAYLSGSWLGALTVCRSVGAQDPRLAGSFNPGFSNVLRLHGKRLALATLLVDAVKGMPVMVLALLMQMAPWEQGIVGLAVLAGHSYPIWHRFRGGKAVASTFGVMLIMSPIIAIISAMIWLTMAWRVHTASSASLTAALAAPLASLWLAPEFFLTLSIYSILIFIRHHRKLTS